MKPQMKEIEEAPNLHLLEKFFGVDRKVVIIAYGDSIYAPNKTLSSDLLIHELVHCARQGFNTNTAERWWKRYMEDSEFRLSEELEAYKQQYLFCCKVYKDKNKRAKILHALASELSSSMYGNIILHSEAVRLIRGMV